MNAQERLTGLEAALDHIRRRAAGNVVVVEGRRDVDALVALGIGGEHVMTNQGRPLAAVADALAESAGDRTVILGLDWDRTGGRLARRLHDALVGRVPVDLECRRRLAKAAHERCVEALPSELAGLRATVSSRHRVQ